MSIMINLILTFNKYKILMCGDEDWLKIKEIIISQSRCNRFTQISKKSNSGSHIQTTYTPNNCATLAFSNQNCSTYPPKPATGKNHNSAISFWALASQLSLTANKQKTEEGEGRSYCLALTVVVPDCKQIQNRGGEEEEGGSHCLVSNVLHYYICLSVSSFGLRFVWMIIWNKFADVSWDLLCAAPSSWLLPSFLMQLLLASYVCHEFCWQAKPGITLLIDTWQESMMDCGSRSG